MILVTGGSGFLGWNILQAGPARRRITATYFHHPVSASDTKWIQMDLGSAPSIRQGVESSGAKTIIHAAAMKDVDQCEQNPADAEKINVEGTEILCEAARRTGARVIYVSTDLVFDGTRSFWKEDDPTRGIGCYARTKRGAEQRVLSDSTNTVVRVSLLYGWSNPAHQNFIDWMWSKLGRGQSLPLFTDQFRTPILSEEAAAALLKLAERKELTGIFHLGGPERISRYEFGMRVCEQFPFDARCINPDQMSDVPSHIPRPADCSLDSRKIVQALGLNLSTVSQGLEKMAAFNENRSA